MDSLPSNNNNIDALSSEQDILAYALQSEQEYLGDALSLEQFSVFDDIPTEQSWLAQSPRLKVPCHFSNGEDRERNGESSTWNFSLSSEIGLCGVGGVSLQCHRSNAPQMIAGQRKRKSEDGEDQAKEKKIARSDHFYCLLPIHIFTDAAGDNGIAGIAVYVGPGHPLNTTLRRILGTTQAEILGAIIALERTLAWEYFCQQNVILTTDCAAIPTSLNKRKKIKNAPRPHTLLKHLLSLLLGLCLKFHTIEVRHVYSHTGNPGNEEADRMARAELGLPPSTTRKECGKPIDSFFHPRRTQRRAVDKQRPDARKAEVDLHLAFGEQDWNMTSTGSVSIKPNAYSSPSDQFDWHEEMDEEEDDDIVEKEEARCSSMMMHYEEMMDYEEMY